MPTVTRKDWSDSQPWIDRPDADVRAYVDRLAEPPDYDLAGQLECWRRDGLVIFEKAVDRALIDDYRADLDHLKEHSQDFDLSVEVKAAHKPIRECSRDELDAPGTKFNHMHTISGHAVRLSLNNTVSQFLSHVFQAPPCVLQSLTFSRGSQQPIHIDYPYVRVQTRLAHLAASWIPLEDIHPDSGPLAYYPGSHHLDASGFFDWGGGSILYERDSLRRPMEFSNYLWDRMRDAGLQPRVFLPRKGDVLIWHGNLAHEGSKIADPTRTRASYVTHYTSLDAYPPQHMFPDALERRRYVTLNGAYSFDVPWAADATRLPSYHALR